MYRVGLTYGYPTTLSRGHLLFFPLFLVFTQFAGVQPAHGDQQMLDRICEGGSYNPHSASYRTLHINHTNAYPNALDRSQGCTGCAIGIHGKCSQSDALA